MQFAARRHFIISQDGFLKGLEKSMEGRSISAASHEFYVKLAGTKAVNYNIADAKGEKTSSPKCMIHHEILQHSKQYSWARDLRVLLPNIPF